MEIYSKHVPSYYHRSNLFRMSFHCAKWNFCVQFMLEKHRHLLEKKRQMMYSANETEGENLQKKLYSK